MIVQFILRLIFFYCVFSLLKSLFKRYTRPASAVNPGYNKRSANNDSNVFEAEYKVVKEDVES